MARRGKAHHEEESASEAWLLPYSDLMTLLLAVFIVLYAVSKVDTAKAQEISAAFRGIFEPNGTSIMEEGSPDTSILDDPASVQELIQDTSLSDLFAPQDLSNLQSVQSQLQEYFQQQNLEAEITTSIDERGLVISLTNSLLFDSGRADIKPDSESILVAIGNSVSSLDNYIRVEGHTDNVPISTDIYPSNWELSSARASRVVRLMIAEVDIAADRLVAVGYGEFKPVADNSTEDGRAQNRRVDIIVLNTKYNTLEDPLGDATPAQQ